ncbi:reverse transcriptase domain-containing protein [Pelagicoccus sp. SDUM812002]|nr:reverse transcriptase domain-containing protein [Pelagicoccus sp. SDUM812002]MDQ8188463.1 reverse transcriptase domain-containing protein [Pelagicoccus sp. SDUM812002]
MAQLRRERVSAYPRRPLPLACQGFNPPANRRSFASDGGVVYGRGVSRGHSSRGNGSGVAADGSPVQRRVVHDPSNALSSTGRQLSENSYGFRPNRRGHDAARRIDGHIAEDCRWSVDIDLKSFFDKVPQARALKALRERLEGAGPVVRLVRRYLQAGYVELGSCHDTPEGMPQGGPLALCSRI